MQTDSKKDSAKKRVGILRGGTGEHYATSLKQGGDIISHIFENLSDKYKVNDILIDKKGVWHFNGMPILPAHLAHNIDVAWDTTYPSSFLLNNFSIPHVAVAPFSHVLANSKEMLREHMKRIDVPMPRSIVLPVYQKDFDGPRERYSIKKAKEVFEKFPSPWIVKSFTPDSSMGIHLAKTFDELVGAIEDGVNHEKSILVEEFIAGKVASVHSVANFRGEKIYTFPPKNLTGAEKEKLMTLVKNIHNHLNAEHYLKSDFILGSRGKIYLLGIELAPDVRPGSHFSESCESIGAKMHDVIEHILEHASVI